MHSGFSRAALACPAADNRFYHENASRTVET